MAATEMYWQGWKFVEGIDVPFAANVSPKVAPARLSAQSLAVSKDYIVLLVVSNRGLK